MNQTKAILIGWLLLVSGGGYGPAAIVFPGHPVSVFDNHKACNEALRLRRDAYAKALGPPIRKGLNWVEGTVFSGQRDAPSGRQIYILRCQRTSTW